MSDNKQNIQNKYNFNNPEERNNNSSSPVSYIIFAVLIIAGIFYLIYGPKITAEKKSDTKQEIQMKNITFKTSNNSALIDHFYDLSQRILKFNPINKNDLIVDIGNNLDG